MTLCPVSGNTCRKTFAGFLPLWRDSQLREFIGISEQHNTILEQVLEATMQRQVFFLIDYEM